jgi:amino acid adenylation domain-containing protein
MDCLAESITTTSLEFALLTDRADEEVTVKASMQKQLIDRPPYSNLIAVDFDPFIDGEISLTAPATESQIEIWLGVQLSNEANLACLLSQSLRLTGQLNLDALQLACRELVNRHESLRTTFSGDGTTIMIAKNIEFLVPIVDLSDVIDRVEQQQEIDRHHQAAVSDVFDLQHGPLFRIKIVKLDDQEHLLILTIHHIVCDGWSFGVIIADLAKIYNNLNQSIESELPQPEYFSEYAFLEQEKIGSVEAIEIETYWLKKFATLPPVAELPIDHLRPPLRTFNSGCESYTLGSSLVKAIEQLGIKHGCSLMTTMLTGFEVFLAKITGQTELVVGVPTSGQIAAGKYGLVGHCVNFLPLRSNVDPECKFSDYLKSRNSSILDDYEHQDFTFGNLLKKLPIPRDASRVPLISAVFNIDLDPGIDRSIFDRLEVATSANRGVHASFEFFLNAVGNLNGEITLDCQYNPNLFSAATIHRHLTEFENLLTAITKTPDQNIWQLSLLDQSTAEQLLTIWNDTGTNYPHKCIQELFEQQVELNGEAIALVWAQEQLTYQELNTRANQLANYLLKLGIQPDQLVGIAIDRSLETIVAILGILKAGGAYLPLDLSYPAERLAFMLADAQVSVLLTKQVSIDRLPQHQAQVVCLDTDWSQIATAGSTNPPCQVQPANLAYVIYTSGSTGQPKGVCVTHQGVVRLVRSTNYVDFSPSQIFLQLAPISFDASTFEIWGSLLNGAKLVLFPGDKPSLAELGQIIQHHQITTLWLTAGLFHLMVDQRIEDLQPLQQLIAGGEALSVPHVQKVLSTLTNCQLINGYGPTESTTFTCCYPIPKTASLLTSVPIGRPIANTQVYILDAHLQPVPIGIPGELHIGGDGLARGYLDRPDLTAEKFISNPLTGTGRLYKTGDLARYLPDGNIEFIGRIDNQVKIRGFRIELGEIEVAISQYPSVREVCVIDREDRPGDKRLVAYVVTDQSAPPTDRELRTFIQSKLPDYLIPSAFVMVSALPLTANGKVDRRALPAPESDRPAAEAALVAPRNELELQLTEIWERLLDVQSIRIRDNFFELGGHSLIAVRLFAEIERIWGQNLPLATLFQKQTIEELASVLQQDEWVAPWSSLVTIQPHGSQPPLFCFHPIGGNILEYYPLAEYLGTDRPIYGLQSQGLDGKQQLLGSIEEMASHYIKEILTVQPQAPYLLAGYSFGGLLVYEVAQQLQQMGKQVDFLGIFDCNASSIQPVRPSFAKSIQIHLNNWLPLENPAKIKYIKDRIDYRFNNVDYRDFLLRSFPEDAPPSIELLQLIDTNFTAGGAYITRPYTGNLTLFRCEMQTLDYYLCPDLGWGDLVSGNVEIYNIPSTHYTILRAPVVQSVAAKLKSCLEKIPTSMAEGGNQIPADE